MRRSQNSLGRAWPRGARRTVFPADAAFVAAAVMPAGPGAWGCAACAAGAPAHRPADTRIKLHTDIAVFMGFLLFERKNG
jgi:hypothetical protein